MKNTMSLGFAVMATALATACSDAGTTPTTRTPVPGDRALDGDPCDREFAIGHECVRRGDICPDGGNRPAVMQCVLNQWRCVIDTTRTCQRTEPPVCRDGEEDGSCSLGICPGGTPVPARHTCIGGRFRCLPVEPGCPAVEQDAGTPDSGTVQMPIMSIRYDGPVSGPVYAGTLMTRLQRTTFRAERDLEIGILHYRIDALDASGFVSDAVGNSFLRNVRLIDEGTGRVLMGPIEIHPGPRTRSADVVFTGAFPIRAGQEVRTALVADVSYHFDPSFTGTRFRVVADGGNGHFFSPNAVRNVSDGTYLSPEAIANNVVIPGNEFTLRRPTLNVDMVNDSSMARYTVKRAIDVPSMSVRLTADPGSDIRVTRIRVGGAGRINIRDPFLPRDFSRVVVACTIRDGDTAVTVNRTPDSFGYMDFGGLNLVITRGTSRIYRVTCTMDSVIEGDFGDAYAIGVANSLDVDAEDSVGTGPDVIVDPMLAQQLSRPTIIMSVGISGATTVTPETAMSYEPTSVRYGTWYTGQTVRIDTTVEPVAIDRLRVRLIGNSRCVESVNVALPSDVSRMLAFPGFFPASITTTATDLELPVPITVGLGGGTISLLVQWRAPVDPAVDPSGCHPGDVVQFGLDRGATAGEWDAFYGGGYNVRITGTVSGERIYTVAPPGGVMNRFRLPAAS